MQETVLAFKVGKSKFASIFKPKALVNTGTLSVKTRFFQPEKEMSPGPRHWPEFGPQRAAPPKSRAEKNNGRDLGCWSSRPS